MKEYKKIVIINPKKIKNPMPLKEPEVPPLIAIPEIPSDTVGVKKENVVPLSDDLGPVDPERPDDDPSLLESEFPAGDIFAEFEGILPDDVTYTIYKIGKTGKQEFCAFAQAPYTLLQIAENYGGGDFIILARDPRNGKYVKKKKISVSREVYDYTNAEETEDNELKMIKRMKALAEIMGGNSKVESQFTEMMANQMQVMMQMSNNMLMQNMEMMKQFNENMNEGGDLAALAQLAEKFIPGVRNKNKPVEKSTKLYKADGSK